MSLKITHKYSTAAGTPPASGDIDVGELAINAADAELYVKDNAGNVRKFQNTTTGAADGVQFTQTGAGAVQRTVESKLQDVVSVLDFIPQSEHADIKNGTSTYDATAAIQAAINAASGGSGLVHIPDGVYRITTGLTIPDDGITIYGDGFGRSLSVSANVGTRLVADFATGWVITCEQACFTLRDIEIYGSTAVRWASAGSVDGTKGCIKLRDGVTSFLERVLVYQEPGIGVYLSKECPNTKLTQVTVEYCKGHAYYIDDSALDSSSGYQPSGIITFDTCRGARANGCAVFAGDPANESGTGLAAYRLLFLNCEFFFCGGDTTLSSHADYVIKLYADNCLLNTCAVSSPNGQAGGNSTTAGTLNDGVTPASLVKGIFIQGRNNTATNTRLIRCQAPGIQISATASSTTINGIEARHTAGVDYNPAIDIVSGADGWQISGVNDPQVADPTNITISKVVASTQPVFYQATDGIFLFSGGDGLYLDTTSGYFGYYDGTTQLQRFGQTALIGLWELFVLTQTTLHHLALLELNGRKYLPLTGRLTHLTLITNSRSKTSQTLYCVLGARLTSSSTNLIMLLKVKATRHAGITVRLLKKSRQRLSLKGLIRLLMGCSAMTLGRMNLVTTVSY
jgi:hypothetical protein